MCTIFLDVSVRTSLLFLFILIFPDLKLFYLVQHPAIDNALISFEGDSLQF